MIQLTTTTTMIMATTITSIILINLIIIISIKMMTRVVLILIDDVDQSLSKIRDIVLVNCWQKLNLRKQKCFLISYVEDEENWDGILQSYDKIG
jgi:hypothetical protein